MTRRFAVIDGLRGLAILAVIYHHVFGTFTGPGWRAVHIAGYPVSPFFPLANGWQAVSLFFILSGFVLMLPYVRGDRTMRSVGDGLSFYVRRLWRLAPLYVFSSVILLSVWGKATPRDYWDALTFSFVLRADTFMPEWNWALWTLALEAWFCLLFPLLVPVVRRAHPAALAAAAFAVSAGVNVVSFRLLPYGMGTQVVASGAVARLPEFVCGMLLARLYVRGSLRDRRFLLAGGIALLCGGMIFTDLLGLGQIAWWLWPLARPLVAAGYLLLVAFLVSREHHPLARAIGWRPVATIGIACYSLYVWHVPLMLLVKPLLGTGHLALYVAVLAAVSTASYWVLERGPGWVRGRIANTRNRVG